MKNIFKISFIALLLLAIVSLLLTIVSCSNDNEELILPQNTTTKQNLKTSLTTYTKAATSSDQASNYLDSSDDCFTINYPYSFVDDQGNVTEINSEEDLYAFINGLDPNTPYNFMYVFPLNITLEDGTQSTLDSLDALVETLFACEDIDMDSPNGSLECFEFNFPLSVVLESGQTIEINSQEELFSIPDAVDFVYPITVTLDDSTVITINDSDAFDELYNTCFNIDTNDEDICFEIVYPLNLIQDNGTITTVSNDDEFNDFIESLGEDDFFTLTYPIHVVDLETDTEQTINNDDEFIALLDNCFN